MQALIAVGFFLASLVAFPWQGPGGDGFNSEGYPSLRVSRSHGAWMVKLLWLK